MEYGYDFFYYFYDSQCVSGIYMCVKRYEKSTEMILKIVLYGEACGVRDFVTVGVWEEDEVVKGKPNIKCLTKRIILP